MKLLFLAAVLALSSCTTPTQPRQVNLKIDGQWREVMDGSVLEYRDAATGRFHPLKITAPTAAEQATSKRLP